MAMQQTNHLGLDFATAPDLNPSELITAAAATGCRCVSLLVQPHPPAAFPDYGLLNEPAARRIARDVADSLGVSIEMIEAFTLGPETDVASFRAAFECGAYLGATFVSSLVRDPNEERQIEHLAQFSELAVELGLRPLVEPIAISSLSTFPMAVEAIRRSGAKALALEVDILHVIRTGGKPEDLLTIDPNLIGRAQINDGPLISTLEPRYEALQQRQIPGEGEFPLWSFLEALPQNNLTIGVEVPLRNLAEQGVGGAERVRRAVAGAKKVMAQM
jgi:sugar phosphate isomerase/epimerase